jgi:hypothetical protein
MSDAQARLVRVASCTKVRYRDRIAALLVLATVRAQDKSHRAKVEVRAYLCTSCRGWHLTSRKPRRAM